MTVHCDEGAAGTDTVGFEAGHLVLSPVEFPVKSWVVTRYHMTYVGEVAGAESTVDVSVARLVECSGYGACSAEDTCATG